MKSVLISLLFISPLFPQFATACTLIVAADSTEEFFAVADAASAAEAGDTVLVRDGWYMENPFAVDSGVVVTAEHSGQAQLWMLNPDFVFITLSGEAKIVGLVIVGHWAGFAQTLVEIRGGPATIYNCLFFPQAHYGLQMAFYCAGQAPIIRYCDFRLSGGSPIVHNFDSTSVWMPYNHYYPATTDTVFIHHLIEWSYPGGEIYISPVLDSFQWLSVEERMPQIPQIHDLQIYPNPFNSTTQIEFTLLSTQGVLLRLYDVLGREVAILVNEIRTAGEHRVSFDAAGLASGVYLCRIEAGGMTQTRKIVLMK